MSNLQITKSHYTAGVQCKKRFYFLSRKPEIATPPSEDLQLRFSQGQSIGALARLRFEAGVLIESGGASIRNALSKTESLVRESSVSAIFEAAVSFENLLVRVDILKNNFDGSWDLIEVKSTTEIKEEHLEDIAFQLYVLRGAGIKIKNTILSHINNKVVFPNLNDFFIDHDMTAAAEHIQAEVKSRISSLITILEKEEAPQVLIGRQCSNPYGCEFKSECWASVPKGSTLELYNYRKRKPTKFELYHQGRRLISELKNEVELTPFQQIQFLASKTDEPIIDFGGLAQFLNQVQYPVYYFDFETIAPAIPCLTGMRPYQRIPVQFSCHIQQYPGGPLEHHEFLASGTAGEDPRLECIEAMKKTFTTEGTIVAYHDDFERSLIRELAESFVDSADFLKDLESRFWDLEDAFHQYFYHKDFGGSVSIKKVLPFFAPEMKYDQLAVKNGGQAQAQLFKLFGNSLTPMEKQKIRADLLTYCAQDSKAMLVIYEKLRGLIGENIVFMPSSEKSDQYVSL